MVTVIGGGISGLTCAHYCLQRIKSIPRLKQKGIAVYEKNASVGGWIATNNTLKSKGMPHLEVGPHTIRSIGKPAINTLQLIDELGMNDLILPVDTSKNAKARLIYYKGQVQEVSIISMFKAMGRRRKSSNNSIPILDESIYSFVERKFGQNVAHMFTLPMICGIYAGDAREISMKAFNKQLFELGQEYRFIIAGLIYEAIKRKFNSQSSTTEFSNSVRKAREQGWRMYTLKGGMQQLPEMIYKSIVANGVNVQHNQKCDEISIRENGVSFVINGEEKHCDYLMCSTPARVTANLVQKHHPELAELLTGIPSVSVATVQILYDKSVVNKEAFGILVHPDEGIPILGVIFDHCLYPCKDYAVLTVMMGGKWFEEYFGLNPTESSLLANAKDAIKLVLGIAEEPVAHHVNILRNCIPQPVVGHCERVNRITDYCRKRNLPIGFCGASYHGVGVNDAILSAKMVADRLE